MYQNQIPYQTLTSSSNKAQVVYLQKCQRHRLTVIASKFLQFHLIIVSIPDNIFMLVPPTLTGEV